jgi:hypothetical protein
MSHRFTGPTPTSLSGRVALELFVESWEIECCAPPPVVGDPTTWKLGFSPTRDEHGPGDHERHWIVARREGWTALTDGPVTAYWSDGAPPPPGPGVRRLRGTLFGTRHGGISPDDAPSTTGTVQRVRLASQVYRLDDQRTLRPVPGTLELADRQAGPRGFRVFDRIAAPGDVARMETGVLIDVTLP